MRQAFDEKLQVGPGFEAPCILAALLEEPPNRTYRQVARDGSGARGLSRWLLKKAIETLSSTGIPGSLYPRSQKSLADRVGRLLESAGTAA